MCVECQREGVPRHATARAKEAAEEAADTEALATALATAAAEHGENDCPVCFEPTPVAEREVLHAGSVHWVCGDCRVDLREHGVASCPMCRCAM